MLKASCTCFATAFRVSLGDEIVSQTGSSQGYMSPAVSGPHTTIGGLW